MRRLNSFILCTIAKTLQLHFKPSNSVSICFQSRVLFSDPTVFPSILFFLNMQVFHIPMRLLHPKTTIKSNAFKKMHTLQRASRISF